MRIRKQVYELGPDDLVEHPVWEYALDEEGEEGQDEATVRPLDTDRPVDPTLPSILEFEGDDGTSSIQPVVVTKNGQVMFWYGSVKPDAGTIRRNYAILGKTEGVFPIRYKSAVNLDSGPIEGELGGFLYFEDEKRGVFSKTKHVVKTTQ